MPSTGFSYYLAFDLPYKTRADDFWWSVAVIHGLGWMFLVLASLLAPARGRTGRRARRRCAGANAGARGAMAIWLERAGFRRRLLDRGAYFWLAARARLRPAYVWAVLGLVACGWVWGLARSGRDWLDEMTYVLTGLLLNLLIKVWFGLEAGRPLAEDRRQGALGLLLSTPLTVKDILRGQLLALRRQFEGPVAVVLLVFLLFMLLAASDALSQQEPADRTLWVLFWAAGMVMLVADLAGLYWLGMWKGLTVKNPTRAAAATLGCILVLPWVAWGLGMLAASLVWPNTAGTLVLECILGFWFGLGLAADLGFGAWARHKLLTDFRRAASRRYEPPPGFWQRLRGRGAPGNPAPPQVERAAHGE